MQPWSIDFLTVFKWQHAHLAYVLPAHTACVSLDRHIEKQRVAKSSFISTLFGSFPSLCLATKRTTAPRIPLQVSIAAGDRCTSLARALWKKSWYLSPEQRSLWLQGTGKRSNSNLNVSWIRLHTFGRYNESTLYRRYHIILYYDWYVYIIYIICQSWQRPFLLG